MSSRPDAARDLSLLHSYVPARAGYDEAFSELSQPRAHWAALLDSLTALGRSELDRRWEKARQLLHENGVSYNVYGDPEGMERQWSLSAIPVIVAEQDWNVIEAGVRQRARLLEAILAD